MSRGEKGAVAKILVIGDVATGKTSIIQRYVYKTPFDEQHRPTLGVDFALKRVRVEETLLNVQLWDIAGQERFIGLAPAYYKHAVAALVVFDITRKETLAKSADWKRDVDDKVFLRNGDNIPVVLFANKWDLVEMNPSLQCATDEELEEFCREQHFVGWFTTSAKTSLHIKKGMNFIITKIMKNKKKLDASMPKEEADADTISGDALGRKFQAPSEGRKKKDCCTLI
jgi:Ras-related protein Rab-32